jgi:hypothetical protein
MCFAAVVCFCWVLGLPGYLGVIDGFVFFPVLLFWALFRSPRRTPTVVLAILAAIFFFAAWGAILLLSYLVTGGAHLGGASPVYGGDVLASAEMTTLAAIMWLLFGVPQRAFDLGLDPDGKGHARAVIVRLVTVASGGLTAGFLVMMYFGGGTLSDLHLGQVLIGALFAVVLLTPGYRALATAVWRRGALGFLRVDKDVRQPWRDAMAEVRTAVKSARARR